MHRPPPSSPPFPPPPLSRPPHGRRRAQPPHRAPPGARGDAGRGRGRDRAGAFRGRWVMTTAVATLQDTPFTDRKSTRLNSSHSQISYAVFCLKKKKTRESLT